MGRRQQLDLVASAVSVQLLARGLGVYALLQGLGMVLGGPLRWSGNPALAAAMAIPGAPASWGVVLIVLSVLTVVGTFLRPRYAQLALGLLGAWSLSFTWVLTSSLLASERSSTTGPPTYGFITFAAMVLAVCYGHARPVSPEPEAADATAN